VTRFLLLVLLCAVLPMRTARAWEHASYQTVLNAHANRGGLDYAALRTNEISRSALNRFVESLDAMPDSAPLADWLNAYNAIVIKSVVERWPMSSVRDTPTFFTAARVRVAGRSMSLDTMENEIIRGRFNDARVHFALNCAAVSCPPLPPHAFEQSTLSATLDRLARAAVANDAFVRVEGRRVLVSELFFWFEADFRRDAGSVIAWLKRFDAGHRLDGVSSSVTLERIPYSWAVNYRSR
jgi:hypothetical protein